MQQSIENSEIKYTANISFIWINLKLYFMIHHKNEENIKNNNNNNNKKKN